MVCKKCGANNPEGSKFCKDCGSELISTLEESKEYNDDINVDDNEQAINSKKNRFIIIMILILVLIAIATCILLFNKDEGKENSKSNSSIESNSDEIISPNDSNVNSNEESNSIITSNVTVDELKNINGNLVTFNGYFIEVPTGYLINSTTPTLQLISKNQRDLAVITIDVSNYDMLKGSPKAIEDYVREKGMVCNNIRTSVYNGIEFTTVEINSSGKNMILGYAKIDNQHMLGIMVANVDYTIDYVQFNTFANVVKTIKKA